MLSGKGVRFASALILLGLAGCEDDCSSHSMYRFTCDQIEKANYNLLFYLPDESELSLGQTSGLNNCAAKATDYARTHSIPRHYACCMITDTSSCAEKHL